MSNSEFAVNFGGNKENEADERKDVVDNTTTVNDVVDSKTSNNSSAGDGEIHTNAAVEDSTKLGDNFDNEPYTDKRSVTIALIKSYSLYRKTNQRVLPKRVDYIGSSVKSSRILASNKEEVETYFPNIIGLAPNNDEFITRVKQYLNNIRIKIDEVGKKFDTSFHYYRKEDYRQIKIKEEVIERAYQKANKNNLEELRKALNQKIAAINTLESSKCKLGYPINIDDYLMYRHCLLYNDVAKDTAFINSDVNIRFYFKDDVKEAEKLRKYQNAVNVAKQNYVKCVADNELFDAVYIKYCVMAGLPVLASVSQPKLDKEIKLDKFSSEEPIKFNKIVENPNVKTIGFIEKLIAHGELVRSQYNQNILTNDGRFIGANMAETVAWFNDVANYDTVSALKTKLSLI